jgi:hypothetical protein
MSFIDCELRKSNIKVSWFGAQRYDAPILIGSQISLKISLMD